MILDDLQPEQAQRLGTLAMKALTRGRVVIVPLRVGLGYLGATDSALGRIFELKRRSLEKPLCLLANEGIARGIAFPDRISLQRLLYVVQLGAPVTVVAKIRDDISVPAVIEQSKIRGLAMYFDGGILVEAILEQASRTGILLFGSSANVSGQGNVFSWSELDESLLRDVTTVGEEVNVRKLPDPYLVCGATLVNACDGRIIRRGLAADMIEEALLGFDISGEKAISWDRR